MKYIVIMMIIGIAGGSGSGKSTVVRVLRDYNYIFMKLLCNGLDHCGLA